MRVPIFLGFGEDKKPEECVLEEEKSTEELISNGDENSSDENDPLPTKLLKYLHLTVRGRLLHRHLSSFSHLDKVFWDKSENHLQLTKKDLIEYYNKISEYLLPYLKDRPLSLSRYPDRIEGKYFYHKNWNKEKPDLVQTVKVHSKSKDGIINCL